MGDGSSTIQPGAEISVVIERIVPGGWGLAHTETRTLFVSLAAPGDHVRVRIDQIRGKIAFASILEILDPSPVRTTPPCVYFGQCGGCDFQQLDYKAQLDAKVEIIRDCLRRIAHLDYSASIPIVASPSPLHYRSNAQWRFDKKRNAFGYFERSSHRVCDVVECLILAPALQDALTGLRERMTEGTLPPDTTEFEAVAGDDNVSVTPGSKEQLSNDVTRTVGGGHYAFSATGFFQVNPLLLPSLIEAATYDVDGKTALDLYCGVGLFTLPLARRFKQVIGVESHPSSATYARRNVARARLDNCSIVCASVGQWLKEHAKSSAPVDFILLDPPRIGVEKGVIAGMLDARPRQIAYVSCDPATLARDLRHLIEGGYAINSLKALDMFPQTHHIETVVRLSASGS